MAPRLSEVRSRPALPVARSAVRLPAPGEWYLVDEGPVVEKIGEAIRRVGKAFSTRSPEAIRLYNAVKDFRAGNPRKPLAVSVVSSTREDGLPRCVVRFPSGETYTICCDHLLPAGANPDASSAVAQQ